MSSAEQQAPTTAFPNTEELTVRLVPAPEEASPSSSANQNENDDKSYNAVFMYKNATADLYSITFSTYTQYVRLTPPLRPNVTLYRSPLMDTFVQQHVVSNQTAVHDDSILVSRDTWEAPDDLVQKRREETRWWAWLSYGIGGLFWLIAFVLFAASGWMAVGGFVSMLFIGFMIMYMGNFWRGLKLKLWNVLEETFKKEIQEKGAGWFPRYSFRLEGPQPASPTEQEDGTEEEEDLEKGEDSRSV